MRTTAFLFFIIPLIEMVLLIQVGSAIGVLPTIGLVMLTAICGVWLLRMEGLATLTRVQSKLQNGELPETELLEGIMLLVGGALLITPGFATDALGFVCLLPMFRRPLAKRIIQTAIFRNVQINTGGSFSFERRGRSSGDPTQHQSGTIIDGEFSSDGEPSDRDRDRLQ